MKEDSCLAPVWISLPRIPLQCFIPEFLESVANRIGRFLCFDKATSTLARPSAARICVEIDLRKTPPPFIWVGLYEGFKQQILYERLPKYCNRCHVIGHVDEGCRLASRSTPSSLVDQRIRTSATRHHTPLHPSTSQQSSNPVVPPPPPPQPNYIAPATAVSSPIEGHFQAHQPAALLQRAPAAAAPHSMSHSATGQLIPTQSSSSQQVSNQVVAHPTSAQASLILPSTEATPPSGAHLQAHPAAATLQRASGASPLQDAPIQAKLSSAPLIRASSAATPHDAPYQVQPTAALVQGVPTAAASSDSVVTSATAANQAQNQHSLISNQTSQPPLSSNPTPGCPTAPSSAQYPPKSPSALHRSDHRVCSPDVCQNAVVCNTFPAVHLGYNQLIGTDGDASIVCRTDSLNQPPLQSLHTMPTPTDAEGTQSVCQNAAGGYRSANDSQKALNLYSAVSLASQVVDKQPGTSKNNQNSTTKSITFKPYDVGNSTSITQQQAEALARFKNKVQEQARIQGKQLSSPYSVNHFEALLDDQSDEEDYVASYNSDTDDGCVEPIDMGYQSADGRSSNKHKGFAPSGMKTNKRHPNMPLNVRLRSRKSSYPSTP